MNKQKFDKLLNEILSKSKELEDQYGLSYLKFTRYSLNAAPESFDLSRAAIKKEAEKLYNYDKTICGGFRRAFNYMSYHDDKHGYYESYLTWNSLYPDGHHIRKEMRYVAPKPNMENIQYSDGEAEKYLKNVSIAINYQLHEAEKNRMEMTKMITEKRNKTIRSYTRFGIFAVTAVACVLTTVEYYNNMTHK